MEENTDIEQARSLVIETSRLMVAYRDNSEKLVNDVRNELDKSLIEQRRMLVQMIREEVTKEVSQAVYAYVKDMEKARNQMADQVREFNGYLRKV
ncbi:hypothetical protein [Neisseria subflava]|jgi:hypothetical protein|uniref:hypothetical protein n=2 Tax=Neisseriaceae TaxID=481 RepID=UPI0027E15E02|nr:hypothetical protein [Neisseria subflava]